MTLNHNANSRRKDESKPCKLSIGRDACHFLPPNVISLMWKIENSQFEIQARPGSFWFWNLPLSIWQSAVRIWRLQRCLDILASSELLGFKSSYFKITSAWPRTPLSQASAESKFVSFCFTAYNRFSAAKSAEGLENKSSVYLDESINLDSISVWIIAAMMLASQTKACPPTSSLHG